MSRFRTRPAGGTRTGRLMAPMTATLILIAANPLSAHLALIRQGPESTETPQSNDGFGRNVMAGDFNGDGYEDLATAAPDEANGLVANAVQGCVVVNYGSEVGLVPENATLLSVGDVSDYAVRYGRGLASGDFDNDGYDDLAVGLPQMDYLSIVDAGAVWIHYGGPLGLSPSPALTLKETDAPNAANEDYDQFGFALAAADFDQDGFDDIAVGAIGEDDNAGAVFHFSGSASGITTTGAGWIKQSSLGQANTPGDLFGYALATGDFDSNGHPDLAIGAPEKDVAGYSGCGRVYVAWSHPSGLSTLQSMAYDAVSLDLAPQSNSSFGFALAGGDFFDTTGAQDLAVGEPEYDGSNTSNSGRVVLLDFIGPPIWPVGADPLGSTKTINQGVNGTADLRETGDQFGFALASGNFNTDDYDDLAVGVPYENLSFGVEGTPADCGMAHVYMGRSGGPGWQDVKNFSSRTQNDVVVSSDLFGQALAFGAFDTSQRDNLAVGTPGKDFLSYSGGTDYFSAGQVYIVAPWRQFVNSRHRSSVAVDCAGDIVYSQRMFQRVRPASTTKTLTLLMACEALQAGTVTQDYMYTVPSWVANSVGGSQLGLVSGEKLTLANLLKGMMTVSGNDCAYAIADVMKGDNNPWGGDYSSTLPDFQDDMNDKVDALGMSGTTMTNPPGLDVGDHYTTARDFAALSWHAMQNPCVRDVVGTSPWLITRYMPINTMNGWLTIGNEPGDDFLEVTSSVQNGYVDAVRAIYPDATGIKGGSTSGAKRTGLFSTAFGNDEVYASLFGVRGDDDPVPGALADSLWTTGGYLLGVAMAHCSADDFVPLPPPLLPPPGVLDVPLQAGTVHQLLTHGEEFTSGDMVVEIVRRTHVAPSVNFRVAVTRNSEIEIAPNEAVSFGMAPCLAHEGYRIVNRGENGVSLVADSQPGSRMTFSLAPSQQGFVPAYPGPQVPSVVMTLVNNSPQTAILEVEELGYRFQESMSTYAFMSTLRREGTFRGEVLGTYVAGLDRGGQDAVVLSIHAPGATSAAPEGDGPSPSIPAGNVEIFPNTPNPFTRSTALRFALGTPGTVSLKIFDLQGRVVRVLEQDAVLEAGSHQLIWDGRDDQGREAASGIYFVRVETGHDVRARRVILAR